MDNTSCTCSIGSLNVRGLNNKIKRNAIFEWLKKRRLDIVLLQECYCMLDTNPVWCEEWGGECIFSNGTRHSCGTMIIFRKGLNIKILESSIDIEGRYVMLKVNIEGEEIFLFNVYGPTKSNEKDRFFNTVMQEMNKFNITVDDKI